MPATPDDDGLPVLVQFKHLGYGRVSHVVLWVVSLASISLNLAILAGWWGTTRPLAKMVNLLGAVVVAFSMGMARRRHLRHRDSMLMHNAWCDIKNEEYRAQWEETLRRRGVEPPVEPRVFWW